MSGLDARLVVDRPGFHLDLALTAAPGETVALLGPNGAGKTTALRALAGLVATRGGHVRVDGAELGAVPSDRRRIGMVFQDYLLFPHLSAVDNVAFGPRCRGVRRAAARREAADWLERVGLAGYAAARPRALSGGQAQRVALARALAVRPGLLLLDEPLAALDAHTRLEVRATLRRHLAGFAGAAVLVTHDPVDALALADRIVVVEDGRSVQEGAPAEVARRPRTPYVARLVGLNLHRARADGRAVTLGDRPLPGMATSLRGEVFLAFSPSSVRLDRSAPGGPPGPRWRATIDAVESRGDRVRVLLGGASGPFAHAVAAEVTAAAVAELGLAEGGEVWAAVIGEHAQVYPA
ncbi:ABC transporter ATP-binding protein [Actinomadura flavalba]|uniref:ABC transporter ATP-binding protein n=1 Tax=Actinomadura flavalba TaxID=1120938 RepID=UPI000361F407|nr:ABC transporter ATP-binding protein [Actinomadura flavalba]